ncbi:hypothetical protein BH09PSE5_BH09PSE5_01960 [soil metagenome]
MSAKQMVATAPDEHDDWELTWAALLEKRAAGMPAADLETRSERSANLLTLYAPLLHAGSPDERAARGSLVVAQLGQSLDGCVATSSGDSYFVTGPQSIVHLHRLRAICDAVLVGAGTVAADNPQLTTRRVAGPNPTRVVLDPSARLDGRSGIFLDGQAPTLWLCDSLCAATAQSRLDGIPNRASGTEVIAIEGLLGPSGFDAALVIALLASRGMHRVFVEGGGVTVSRFLAAGCLDRLHLIVAPVLIGAGKPGLLLPPWATMSDCPRPPATLHRLGEDILWDLDLQAARPPIKAPSGGGEPVA